MTQKRGEKEKPNPARTAGTADLARGEKSTNDPARAEESFVKGVCGGAFETAGFYNALIVTDDPVLLDAGRKSGTTRFTVATRCPERFAGIADAEIYRIVEADGSFGSGGVGGGRASVTRFGGTDFSERLYLPSISLPDETIDAVTAHVLETGAKLIVRACSDLEETGRIEARFRLSPVMLLHKLGLLDACVITGGVYLDHDDIDLMVQNAVPLVLTVTDDLGGGYGAAPLVSLRKRGLYPRLGTGCCAYNLCADLRREAAALLLSVCGAMADPEAVSPAEALGLARDESARLRWKIGGGFTYETDRGGANRMDKDLALETDGESGCEKTVGDSGTTRDDDLARALLFGDAELIR